MEAYVLAHQDKEWDWYKLSSNPNISTEFIAAHPELPWQWTEAVHPARTLEYLDADKSHERSDECNRVMWRYWSANPNLTIDYVLLHADRKWDISCFYDGNDG